MKITEIRIDGFKNIRDTCLNFSDEPIIILLAPNNYGKTNLINGIQEGFSLIRKQGTEVVDYIRNRSYIDKFITDNNIPNFTFEVKFFKRSTKHCIDTRMYHYKLVIDGNLTNQNDPKSAKGVIEESLSYILFEQGKTDTAELVSVGSSVTLFERDVEDPSIANLLGGVKADIKHSSYDKDDSEEDEEKLYPSEWYLFLHKLGNMALVGEKNENELIYVLKEIAGVLTSLTRENIGMIIADEGSEYRIPIKLANDVKHLEEDNKAEYNHFVNSFCKMFGKQYKNISLQPLADKFHILFEGENKKEDSTTLSYGTRRVFKLLSQVYANKTPLVCLEEIEVGLHPLLYRDIIDAFFQSVDEKCYDQRNVNTSQNKKRKNEPRLIISSHAPGIINRLDNRLNSVYIGIPSYSNKNALARFKQLNSKGKKEVIDLIYKYNGSIGAGDIIFDLLFNVKEGIEEAWLNE